MGTRASRLSLVLGVGLSACVDPTGLYDKRCDEQGRCLDGFRCDRPSNLCIPEGMIITECQGQVLLITSVDGQQRQIDCPLGCNAEAEPDRCYLIAPSNLGSTPRAALCSGTQSLLVQGAATLDTDTGRVTHPAGSWPIERFQRVPQPDGAPALAVAAFSSVQIPPAGRLRVTGQAALMLLVCTDVAVDGTLDCGAEPGVRAGAATERPS